MFRYILFITVAFSFVRAHAQPDSLYVPELAGVAAYAVRYPALQNAESFTHVGRYAMDTTRIAVRLGYKRGKPCGVYRAYYPDGRPLIFAVYGWGWLQGDWTEYAPDGHITVKGQYKEGKRDGKWAFRDQDMVGHYKAGMKHGKWKYFENGRVVRTEKYRKDVLLPGSRFLFN
jgi:hypothetical protein